jgi:hypothetical protein
MALYNMLYLGIKQWRKSSQCLPSIPAILMIDNEATVQIAKKLCPSRSSRRHPLTPLDSCNSQLANILTKMQLSSKIDPHLTKIFFVLPDHKISTPANFGTLDLIQEG